MVKHGGLKREEIVREPEQTECCEDDILEIQGTCWLVLRRLEGSLPVGQDCISNFASDL